MLNVAIDERCLSMGCSRKSAETELHEVPGLEKLKLFGDNDSVEITPTPGLGWSKSCNYRYGKTVIGIEKDTNGKWYLRHISTFES
jgi:hypothetical protein